MGDNQQGPLDIDQAAAAFGALAEEDNEEREEPGTADAEDDGVAEDTEDGEQESDEEDEEQESEEEAADKSYTVKVDGKEIQVTQKELLSGYQRQADYTRKSMALAEERKASEAELSAVRGERQQLARWAQQMLVKLQREAPQEPNWEELRQTDPIGFATAWAEHQRYREHQGRIAEQYQAVMAKNQEEEAAALSRTLAAEAERLAAVLPEWKDEAKASKEKAALLQYGKKMGFSDQELNAVYDHRTVLVLRKAMLYDRIAGKRPEVNASRQAPRVSPPNGNSPRRLNDAAKAAQRLAKTGSIKDAAAAFERFL